MNRLCKWGWGAGAGTMLFLIGCAGPPVGDAPPPSASCTHALVGSYHANVTAVHPVSSTCAAPTAPTFLDFQVTLAIASGAYAIEETLPDRRPCTAPFDEATCRFDGTCGAGATSGALDAPALVVTDDGRIRGTVGRTDLATGCAFVMDVEGMRQ